MQCFFLRTEAEDACCVGIRCAAHSLQLLKDLEGKPLVKGAMGTMELLLEKLEDVSLQDKLKGLQKAAGNGVP